MLEKRIDRSLCDACGECIRICASSRVLVEGPEGFPRYAFEERCIDCGHCLAICPRGAITFRPSGMPGSEAFFAEARLIDDQAEGDDPLLRTLFSVRSTRFFEGRPVEKAKLELLMEAMVRSPSAGNEQNRNFIIFSSPKAVNELDSDTREYYRRSTAMFADPATAKLVAETLAAKDLSSTVMRNRLVADLPLAERVSAYQRLFRDVAERPNDPEFSYFRHAPAAILVTSSTNTEDFHKAFHKADVEIAVTYGSIAAAALGLSTCRMGLSEMAFANDGSMREKHGIPANERVDGILAIGYSSLRWKRIPPRGPVKAVWR